MKVLKAQVNFKTSKQVPWAIYLTHANNIEIIMEDNEML